MTALKCLLEEKRPAISRRWMDEILGSYAAETGAFLSRKKDRFGNPVGHALRGGTEAVFGALLNDSSPEQICHHLDEIIRVRAIQDFSPSEAVAFVFSLKGAVRSELQLEKKDYDPSLLAELAGFESQVDQVALFAFDVYVKCREQVFELRINEVKRNVGAILERFNRGNPEKVPSTEGLETKSSCAG